MANGQFSKMTFESDNNPKENWKEQQIENQLKSTNEDLKGLKDLIITDNVLKASVNDNTNNNIEITAKHSKAILTEAIKNKTKFSDIYSSDSAGIIFAVQHLLSLQNILTGTIDGVFGTDTKNAVKEFQKKWNEKNQGDKIAEDGVPGHETISKLLETEETETEETETEETETEETETEETETEETETEETETTKINTSKFEEIIQGKKDENNKTKLPDNIEKFNFNETIKAIRNVLFSDEFDFPGLHGSIEGNHINKLIEEIIKSSDEGNKLYVFNNNGSFNRDAFNTFLQKITNTKDKKSAFDSIDEYNNNKKTIINGKITEYFKDIDSIDQVKSKINTQKKTNNNIIKDNNEFLSGIKDQINSKKKDIELTIPKNSREWTIKAIEGITPTSLDLSNLIYSTERQQVFDKILEKINFDKITKLDCSSLNNDEIKQVLNKIRNKDNLQHIDLSGSDITTLDIKKYNNLTQLDVSSCKALTNLDISKNAALTSLDVAWTGITALDVSNNTALTSLNVAWTGITALDVSKNTALTSLDVVGTGITALDVSNNTALTSLNAIGCKNLTNLDISKNTALTSLHMYWTGITALDVSKNTNLEYLFIEDRKVNIVTLPSGKKLERKLANAYDIVDQTS